MKKSILIVFILIYGSAAFSQQYLCRQDTAYLFVQNYRGILNWQHSGTGYDWSIISGANRDSLMIVASEPGFYRSEIIDGLCAPVYSEAVQILINEPPVVTLESRDSVCSNETAFIITGGNPAGGTYWGPGLTDGKFNPAAIGPGRYKVFYRFKDNQTNCADTAFTFINVIGTPNRAEAGSDKPFIAADSIRLEGNIPLNGHGIWTVTHGMGGRFSNPNDPSSWFIRDSANLSFTIRWTISGKCGTSYDETNMNFFQVSINPCPGAPTVTDADGNVYPTVQIGDQCWMGKNLNVGRYVASTVTNRDHADMSNNNIIEKYCLYNDPYNCDLYGGLYDWDEAMGYSETEGTQGICPVGWHMPTEQDWKDLNNFYIYGDAGARLKVGGSSGFEAYFAGDRHAQGEFYSFGASGFFWQSSSYIYDFYNEGYIREVAACNGLLVKNHFNKKTGISVRCLKDK